MNLHFARLKVDAAIVASPPLAMTAGAAPLESPSCIDNACLVLAYRL